MGKTKKENRNTSVPEIFLPVHMRTAAINDCSIIIFRPLVMYSWKKVGGMVWPTRRGWFWHPPSKQNSP